VFLERLRLRISTLKLKLQQHNSLLEATHTITPAMTTQATTTPMTMARARPSITATRRRTRRKMMERRLTPRVLRTRILSLL
jgi:hypothetical protein